MGGGLVGGSGGGFGGSSGAGLIGLDLNHNGRADVFVMGADGKNLEGIVDVLEQGMGGHHKHHHHHDHHHHGHHA